MTHYFYLPGAYSAVEQAELIDGVYTGRDSGNTHEQLKASLPSVVVLSLPECINAIREAARMPVQEISEATFRLFRESGIMDLQQTSGGTTFKCREFIAADIATFFVAVKINRETQCFTFREVDSLDHDQILAHVLENRQPITELV